MTGTSHIATEARSDDGAPVSRRRFAQVLGVSGVGLALPACAVEAGDDPTADSAAQTPRPMPAQTESSQAALTPQQALDMLVEGNGRFVAGVPAHRDLAAQVQDTASGQYPFAVVLGCIDSRVPVEVVFDQGIGDIFSARVAGNIVNEDLLGSMEFACRLAGSKVVMVLGHTACGAVKGAISSAELGNLTGLVQKIEPAVTAVEGERDVSNSTYVDQVAEVNVRNVMDDIRRDSPVLAEMEQAGEVMIVGAMYDVGSGRVRVL